MNILIITHSYAPDPRPRAFRWTAIAEEWAKKGFRVDVVTTGRRGGETHGQSSGVHVHRVGERLMSGVAGPPTDPAPPVAHSSLGTGKIRRLLRSFAKLCHDCTWKKLYWPDYACLWYFPALKEARRLCGSRNYDGVITVSHPFTSHLIGNSLKKAFPALRWAVDIGDPFSADSTVPSNNLTFYRRLNRRTEASVLAACNAISVTVEGCRKLFVDDFAVAPDKIHVIPPLMSLVTETNEGTPPFDKNGSVDLVYLGVLYASIRRPDAVLALFAALQADMPAVRLHFIGDIRGCDDDFARYADVMGTSVLRHGPVARNRVAGTMAASDALINIGNDTFHQMPSKLVEYVASGRPIINVVASDADTSVEFLKDYPRALTLICPNHLPTAAQVNEVKRFLTDTPNFSEDCHDRFMDRFRLNTISNAYETLIGGNGSRTSDADSGKESDLPPSLPDENWDNASLSRG